jgi:hypothetical protein
MIEKLKCTPLSRPAAQRLLEETPHVLDRELSIGLGIVFALADGRALIFFERGRSKLFPSRDELAAAYRADMERIRGGYSPLLDVLPQGQGFAAAVPELLRDAPALLAIDASALDFSVKSVALLDDAVRRLGRTKALTPEVFPSLLAYVGEVVRRVVDGRWEVRSEDGRSWIPCVVDERQHEYPVFGIYKGLLEYGPQAAPLRQFVEFLIGK